MSPLAHSLLALTVVTLLHGACADSLDEPNLQCTTVRGGKEDGVKKVLDTIYIPAGQRSTTVDLPTLCTDNNNLAENVTVCDDVPPTVRVRKWSTEHWLHTSVSTSSAAATTRIITPPSFSPTGVHIKSTPTLNTSSS